MFFQRMKLPQDDDKLTLVENQFREKNESMYKMIEIFLTWKIGEIFCGAFTLNVKKGKFFGDKSVSVSSESKGLVAGPIMQIAV